ncbi:LysR family transcriptional regulator [Sneathiella litorea]|uniref:LysR family transcriptional regulator n=1 Tax=Sneathiella litorea TaxID=2606216 RepID=A0A6L8W670_9PROT|nr:LysR family transcriptional regulator [Sneathiella litorea]MZR30645.1 LysR family transcriptional regulator [Sneathiella litorea]
MRISYLRTFITIAETGGFMAAANILNRTPSAISLQMKALEDAFGTELFDRTKRPPILNRQGRAILGAVQDIVGEYDKLEQSIATKDFRGEFVLGAMPTTLTGIVPKSLAACQRRFPNLLVRLVDDHSAGLLARLKNRQIDAAIIITPLEVEPTIRWRPIAREPFIVIAPMDAKATKDSSLLQEYPYIRFNNNAWTGKLIDEQLKKRSLNVHMTMELENLQAVATMVYNGLGVSIIPQNCVDSGFPLPLKQIPFGNPPIVRTIGLAELSNNPKEQITQGVYEELVAAALSR